MKRVEIIILVAVALIGFGTGSVVGTERASTDWVWENLDYPLQQAYILEEINQIREKEDPWLDRVHSSEGTCRFARKRLAEVQVDFSHDGFKNTSERPFPSYRRAGENLAKGYRFYEVVDAWLESPSHRAILLGEYSELCVEGEKGYWVLEARDL